MFLFQPGSEDKDLKRDLRVQLYGQDNRIRLWAQMDIEEVWTILTKVAGYR